MVALGVELLSAQVGQAVDVIEVVEAVPVGLEGKAAGEAGVQRLGLGRGEADQAEGYATLRGVGLHGGEDGGDVARAGGVDVGIAQGAPQAGHQEVPHPGDPLVVGVAPGKEVGKVVLTAPVVSPAQQLIHPGLVGELGLMKFDHGK